MILKEEIKAKAQEFDVHPSNLQRDYMFGWLLSGIAQSDLKDQLILKGGNAFRKGYFENTRFSRDLDFGTIDAIDDVLLKERLNGVCDYVQSITGVNFDTDRTVVQDKLSAVEDVKVTEARLYFSDFYGNPESTTIRVSMDITEYDMMYLPTQSRPIIHPYSDRAECVGEIQCQKLEELLANKLKCLLQRRNANDLYDFVYSVLVNQELAVNRGEIISVLFKKTIYEGGPHIVRDLLIGLPFEVFRAAWSKYLLCPKVSWLDFEDTVTKFKQFAEELFGALPQTRSSFEFCPAPIRNIIMDAGANQTLLEVRYDGYTRIVEPYSLAYKRRKDRIGREYFYVFDRHGGNSGKKSIKSFFPSKLSNVRDTGEKFTPQFPIELSKAGEQGDNAYFSKPFPSRPSSSLFGRPKRPRISSRPSRNSFGGITYIFKCSYCNKEFPRKSMSDNKLNPHKNSYGGQCYGAIGYFVRTR